MFEDVLQALRSNLKQIEDLNEWLFVTINTMKAIIDNSNREDVQKVKKAAECSTTAELQRMYDMIQGKYGREGFSYRNNPSYYYLSSLVARYPNVKLTEEDKQSILNFFEISEYFLYKI